MKIRISNIVAICICLVVTNTAIGQESKTIKHQVFGYRDGMAMYYDVEIPENQNGLGVVFIVSGGFLSGEDNLRITEPFWRVLVQNGYTVFHLYHPAHPTYRLPDQFESLKLGVTHIQGNAVNFGVDNERLGVFGISSGGQHALLLGLSPNPAERVGTEFKAIVSMMALVDASDPVFNNELFGARHSDFDPELYPVVSPVSYVTPDDPPTLLIHGINDRAVDFEENSVRMQRLLEEQGVTNSLLSVDAGHEIFPEPYLSQARSAMLEWFAKHL